jgi:hypothetical protein
VHDDNDGKRKNNVQIRLKESYEEKHGRVDEEDNDGGVGIEGKDD